MLHLLFALLMSPIKAQEILPPFTLCEEKSSLCEAREVKAEVYERKVKAEPKCDEITAINHTGTRSIIYYECRILLNDGESAFKIKIQPHRPKSP